MTVRRRLAKWAEAFPVPDAVSRTVISSLVARTDRALAAGRTRTADFARDMDAFPIAHDVDAANTQHYEVPAEFFGHILGPQRKYSCCYYDRPGDNLADAEERALTLTAEHADLRDGQTILELGCGWGSLSIWMAKRFPNARIVAVSNSSSQKATIDERARRLGLMNLTVLTADMNGFETAACFDRIVSVEMFEHMSNWRELLRRIRGWLTPDGRLFIHVFAHAASCYRFDSSDASDWIAQHFFTGGLMPSGDLAHCFPELFAVEQEWRWSGHHYHRTANDWLKNFDRNVASIDPILEQVYGAQAAQWRRRWRLFFMATSGLFGHAGGICWGVHHYRLRPT